MLIINRTTPQPIEFIAPSANMKSDKARRAAQAHKINRQNLQQIIKPGIGLSAICNFVENNTRVLLKGEKNDGIGFPTGVSLNECAAHFSMNPNDEEIYLKETDVLKIDFGTHVDGIIMDSAFTVCFDPKKENLLKASKEATMKGISLLKVDAHLSDIGEAIGEVICSYEVEIDGKMIPIKPVANLNGHSIEPFKIHAGISIPCVKNGDMTKITTDTFYALETFATTGSGYVRNGENCSHFMVKNPGKPKIKNPKTIKVYETINTNLMTLPFSPRNIDTYLDFESRSFIKMLTSMNYLEAYPPLNDTKGSFVSQFEHTCYVNETSTEILTLGDDY
ncbi:Methionine aminopeptidase 2 [Cucumispora dikerogammari]|nr:Methionine aminopeptidase 2 [Cucumispora dikerogammari]